MFASCQHSRINLMMDLAQVESLILIVFNIWFLMLWLCLVFPQGAFLPQSKRWNHQTKRSPKVTREWGEWPITTHNNHPITPFIPFPTKTEHKNPGNIMTKILIHHLCSTWTSPRKAIPASVRRDQPMDLPDGQLGEAGSLALLKDMLSCSAPVGLEIPGCS